MKTNCKKDFHWFRLGRWFFVNNLLIWPGEDWNLGTEGWAAHLRPCQEPVAAALSSWACSSAKNLPRQEHSANSQAITPAWDSLDHLHPSLEIWCINSTSSAQNLVIYHRTNTIAHLMISPVRAATNLMAPWGAVGGDRVMLKFWIISLVYREPFKAEQLQEQMYFHFCGVFWHKPWRSKCGEDEPRDADL